MSPLKNQYLHIQWNDEKQDIELPDELSAKAKKNIIALFERFGFDQYFGRPEVMETLP